MRRTYLRQLREYLGFEVRDLGHGFDDKVDVGEVGELGAGGKARAGGGGGVGGNAAFGYVF